MKTPLDDSSAALTIFALLFLTEVTVKGEDAQPAIQNPRLKFVINSQGCPVCQCNGENHLMVENFICVYPPVSSNLPQACKYTFECPSKQECLGIRCTDSKRTTHLEGMFCGYDFQCPEDYECHNMACDLGTAKHTNQVCYNSTECGSDQTCKHWTCYYNSSATVKGSIIIAVIFLIVRQSVFD
ncbi:unnamed protein product [Soboliphyme baturini]|uniref:EB domain-containing protein n=1 Tax=Soboliphyme baturini TaxID=241478 RepID=A0A183IZH6_9BILA|nr:unnamed protein product [Soboliphyme baturini]